MPKRSRSRKRFLIAVLAGGMTALSAGCALLQVAEDQEKDAAVIRFKGTVTALEPDRGPLVVVLMRRLGRDDVEDAIVDYYTRETDGPFYFAVVEPGIYSLAAFQDRNANLVYEPDEPGVNSSDATTFETSGGKTHEGIDFVIRPDVLISNETGQSFDIRGWAADAAERGVATTARNLATLGAVVDLADPRFGSENGRRGLWKVWDFIFAGLQGIYFLEPYDPQRTPVLFVHGISGYPQEFTALLEHLDRERFQPWFFFYASGEHLFKTAEQLVQLLLDLQLQHGFEQLVVVAHSMGGLVSRDFVLRYAEATGRDAIPTFISISTPWGGHAAANSGVEYAPVVVYSWNQMATDSEYIRSLFYEDPETQEVARELPEQLSHHLIFSFQRDGMALGASGDGVVSVESELYPPAQAQAVSVYGVNASHTGILEHPLTLERSGALLAEAP